MPAARRTAGRYRSDSGERKFPYDRIRVGLSTKIDVEFPCGGGTVKMGRLCRSGEGTLMRSACSGRVHGRGETSSPKRPPPFSGRGGTHRTPLTRLRLNWGARKRRFVQEGGTADVRPTFCHGHPTNAASNETALCVAVRDCGSGDVPHRPVRCRYEPSALESAPKPNAIERELHPGALKINARTNTPAPRILKTSHELSILNQNLEGAVLESTNAARSILPGAENLGTVICYLFRRTRGASCMRN